jgi:VCBS repeat-containing protein
MATDTTNVTNATAGIELHEHDVDQAQLTQANGAPVVVQVPAGENVVRVQVTPGETIQLPFPIDAVVARLGDNGNLAVKVGDVTVILLGYAEATGQADVTIVGTDARPMDVAAVLAATDPNLDIQTAAGPAAGADAAGADNNGGVFAPFDPSDGLGGLNAVGGLDPTALNYNLIQRQTVEIIEDDVVFVDNTPTFTVSGPVLINEDDLPWNPDGKDEFLYAYGGNDKYDSDDNEDNDGDGSPEAGDGEQGQNNDMDPESLVQHVLIDVDFHGEVPGDLKLLDTGLPAWKSNGQDIVWMLSPDGHMLTGSAGGVTIIEITVTNFDTAKMDGHFDVSVELKGPLDHDQAGVSPNIQDLLTTNVGFEVTDSNGSPVQGAFEAIFKDDVPFDMEVLYVNETGEEEGGQSPYQANLIDEDDLPDGNGDHAPGDDDVNPYGEQSYARVEGFLKVQFGGDGPATVDPFKFGVEAGQPTGYKTAAGDDILWGVTDPQHIYGYVDGQKGYVFEVHIELNVFFSGYFLFSLYQPLQHDVTVDPETQLPGFEDNLLLNFPVIATDADGDSISTNIVVEVDDDMPRIVPSRESDFILISDETVRPTQGDLDAAGENGTLEDGDTAENDEGDANIALPAALTNPAYGDVIGKANGAFADLFTYDAGADGEKSHAYSINLINVDPQTDSVHTDLKDTQSGLYIDLVQDPDGTVRGVVTIDDVVTTVFAITVDPISGDAALAQYRAVDHGSDGTASFPDEVIALGGGYLEAGLTVTDKDGDTVSSSRDIGNLIRFEDDGPAGGANITVFMDDDLLSGGNEGAPGDMGDQDPDSDDIGGAYQQGQDGSISTTGALNFDFGSDKAGLITIGSVAQIFPDTNVNVSFENVDANGAQSIVVTSLGTLILRVEILDPVAGTYKVTQYAPWPHAAGGEENDNYGLDVGFRIIDGDGDVANTHLIIKVNDDTPVVTLTDAAIPTLVDDDSTLGDDDSKSFAGLFSFSPGADGAAGKPAYELGYGGNSETGIIDVATGFKVFLKMDAGAVLGVVGKADGTYDPNGAVVFKITVDGDGNVTLDQQRAVQHDDSQDPDEANSPVQLTLNHIELYATLTDKDGDTDSQVVNITNAFQFKDDGPSAGSNATVLMDDDLLAGGIEGGPGDVNDDDPDRGDYLLDNGHPYTTGILNHNFGADGAGTVLLTGFSDLGNLPAGSGFKLGGSGDGLQLYVKQTQGGVDVTVLTIEITDPATGAFKVTQVAPILHPEGDDENNVTFTVDYKVTDKDGDYVQGHFNIDVDDDTPTIARNTVGAPALTVDDTTLGTDATQSFAGLFTASAGADGQDGSIAYVLGIKAPGVDSGIIDVATGYHVYLYQDGDKIEGLAGANPQDAQSGQKVVFVITVDANGNVTLDQQRAVQHDDPLDPQESGPSAAHLLANDLVTLTATITDKDGDPASATANIGSSFNFLDDGPDARNDFDNVNNALNPPSTDGNVITGAGTNDPANGSDTVGADSAKVSAIASVEMPGNLPTPTSDQVHGAGFVVAGEHGTLTIYADGYYTYTRFNSDPLIDDDKFTYTLKDGDNDTDTATLTINIYDQETELDLDPEGENDNNVDEKGLPIRTINAIVEPAGTGEAADGNGTDDDDTSEKAAGTLTFSTPDGFGSLVVGGTTITGVIGQVIQGQYGELKVTGYVAPNGGNGFSGALNYTYTLKDNVDHSGGAVKDDFAVAVTDTDGDHSNGTISIAIVDDAPIASNDGDHVTEGLGNKATGNVVTAVDVLVNPDSNNTDGTIDQLGADGGKIGGAVTAVRTGAENEAGSAGTIGVALQGTYGTLTLQADGGYVYTLTAASVPQGAQDKFTYTITDGDGDTDAATLTIDIDQDTRVPAVANSQVTVDEEGLPARNGEPAGTNAAGNSKTSSNSFFINTQSEGLASLTIGGQNIVLAGPFPQTPINDATGTLVITNVTFGAGGYTVNYTYTLKDNSLLHNVQGNADTVDGPTFAVVATDLTGDAGNGSLKVIISDDAPIASNDGDHVTEGLGNKATGNVVTAVDVLVNPDSNNTDGTIDQLGADGGKIGGAVTAVRTGAENEAGSAGTIGVALQGTYGTLTLQADGGYVYTLTAASVPQGAQDKFTYTITDGDGDTDAATLTIDIDQDTRVPAVANSQVTVDEEGLPARNGEPAGTNAAGNSKTSSNSFFINTQSEGLASLTIGGQNIVLAGPFPQTPINDATGTLVITNVTFGAGGYTVNYTYTLKDNSLLHNVQGNADTVDGPTFAVVATDLTGDAGNGSLKVIISDDAPIASNDNGGSVNGGATVDKVTVATGVLGNDNFGADDAKAGGGVVGVIPGSGSTQSTTGVNTPIETSLGFLTLHADGTYSYTAKSGVGGTDSFTYTIQDGDGDRTTAVLSINVVDQANGQITGNALVYEDGIKTVGGSTPVPEPLGITFTPADNEQLTSLTIKLLPTGWKIYDGVTLLETGTGADVVIDTTVHTLANLKILPPVDNADGDISLNISGALFDPTSATNSIINGTLTVQRDAVADKPTNVEVIVSDSNDAGSTFSPSETGTVQVKATFADYQDNSEVHTVTVQLATGFTSAALSASGVLSGYPYTYNSATGVVVFTVPNNTQSMDVTFAVTAPAGSIPANPTFTATATATETNFAGTEPDATNNVATASASTGVPVERAISGTVITNSNVTKQQLVLTVVDQSNPIIAAANVFSLFLQGQQGTFLLDGGFVFDSDDQYAVAIESVVGSRDGAGTQVQLTDFGLQIGLGVTTGDLTGSGNVKLDDNDDAAGPNSTGYTAVITPDTGHVDQALTASLDGTAAGATHTDPSANTGTFNMTYGAAGADTLNGSNDADLLRGGPGVDTLNGNGGNDVLVYGVGDHIFGGAGTDILRVDDGAIALTKIQDGSVAGPLVNTVVDLENADIHDVESILITQEALPDASFGTTVRLDAQNVLNFTDANDTLYVVGNSGDKLVLGQPDGGEATWVDGNANAGDGITKFGSITVGGVTFNEYHTSSGGKLYVDNDITVQTE